MYALNPDIFKPTNPLSSNEEVINEVLKYLRGFFQNIYVGGSYATYKAFNKNVDDAKDIDVFILGARKFETWALEYILKGKFSAIDMPNAPEYYKIQNQLKRVKAEYNGIRFDLIFCDLTIGQLIHENTACDLSKMYYRVTYREAGLRLHLNTLSTKVLQEVKETKVVSIKVLEATEAHYTKMLSRTYNFGFTVNKY